MPHLLVINIDEVTLAAIEELVDSQATPAIATLTMDGRILPKSGHGESASMRIPTLEAAAADIPVDGSTHLLGQESIQPSGEIKSGSRMDDLSPLRPESGTLYFSCWRLDLAARELRTTDDALVPISRAEFELLYVFAKHPHRWLTRRQILHFMRGDTQLPSSRSIDVYVSRLRRKLETDVRSPKIVQTVRNGYKFSATVTIR